MNYRFGKLDEMFDFFESRTNFEKISLTTQNKREYRLDRMHRLCSAFGSPQNSFKTIHIAGSKGKGSTAAYIAALMTATGYKVGIYASPHFVDYRERFQIYNRPFPEDLALETANHLIDGLSIAESSLEGESPATTFELLTLFGFMFFRKSNCDYVALECGLGGRLDATNVINRPKIAVITPIELEHTEILGPTLTHIAREKAGIFHFNSTVWTARQVPAVLSELRKTAETIGIPFFELSSCLNNIQRQTSFCWELIWNNAFGQTNEKIELGMGGYMQAENAALALAVTRYIEPDLKETAVKSISTVTLPGRFQVIKNDPLIVLDGAHTPASIEATAQAFIFLKTRNFTPILLFGCAIDKNVKEMARILLRNGFHHVIVSTPGTFKKSDLPFVVTAFTKAGATVELIPHPAKAWQRAMELAFPYRGLLVTGSIYMAGEIAKILRDND